MYSWWPLCYSANSPQPHRTVRTQNSSEYKVLISVITAHFLRSLKSDNDNEDNANSGHFMRALRSDHFLRALRAYGSKDLQRILRSDPNVTPNNEEEEDEFSRPMRTNGDHFLRSLRSSDHFLRSLRSAHDFMRMVRSGDHFLRSLKSDPVEN